MWVPTSVPQSSEWGGNPEKGVNKHVDKEDPVDIVYLDFQKAFDKVPHQRLLRKLSCHGIRGKILSWIENRLKDREQRVGINGKFSEWREVNSGVPQGSVLGPILFHLFTNDLEKGVNSEVAKFADDTKLLRTVKTKADCEALQKDLTNLGVIVDSSVKTSTQCAAAVKKANGMLGIIKKGIENKTENILLPLYKSIVHPHLEYCVQMWSPVMKRDCS
ncbi:unnamed protein product [Caretta caretta]